MKSDKRLGLIALSAVVIAIVIGAGVGMFVGHNKPLEQTVITPIDAATAEQSDLWGTNYPAQYESWKKTAENTENPSHFVDMPYMEKMYQGIGYAAEFNEPRGHAHMLEDLRNVNDKRWGAHQAACWTCKSTQIPGLVEEYGDEFFNMSFDEIGAQITETVGCYNCHDPETNELRVSQPPLIEAFERQGIDINKEASRQEMRSLVCAQCHVTYFFEPENDVVTFPWDEGLTAEDQIAYYDNMNYTEFVHSESGSPLIKTRHEEYEYFKGSVHESAGVSCADCHMPYMKEGNQKISSHNVGSPMDTIEQSCMTCHREGEEWLRSNVESIQTTTKALEDRGGEVVTKTIDTIALAKNTEGIDEDMLKQAQQLHRYGQYYLDAVYVTNGFGFHNPQRSMDDLAKGIDYCQEATNIANQAILKANGTLLEYNDSLVAKTAEMPDYWENIETH